MLGVNPLGSLLESLALEVKCPSVANRIGLKLANGFFLCPQCSRNHREVSQGPLQVDDHHFRCSVQLCDANGDVLDLVCLTLDIERSAAIEVVLKIQAGQSVPVFEDLLDTGQHQIPGGSTQDPRGRQERSEILARSGTPENEEDGDVFTIIQLGKSRNASIAPDELLATYARDTSRFRLLEKGAESLIGQRIAESRNAFEEILFRSRMAVEEAHRLLSSAMRGRIAISRILAVSEEPGVETTDRNEAITKVVIAIRDAWGLTEDVTRRGRQQHRPVYSRKPQLAVADKVIECGKLLRHLGFKRLIVHRLARSLDVLVKRYLDDGVANLQISMPLFSPNPNGTQELIDRVGEYLLDQPKSLREFRYQYSEYRRAIHDLSSANLRLVVSIARKFRGCGLPLVDVIQAGNCGLLRACEKFDYRRSSRFSTYASHWIRQAILRELQITSRCIRLPSHSWTMFHDILRFRERFERTFERLPTSVEIGKKLKISQASIDQLGPLANEPIPFGELTAYDLDRVVRPLPGQATSAWEYLCKRYDEEKLLQLLTTLDARSELIIRLRFGLAGGPELTLEEIGHKLNLTRERIRQLEHSALGFLRNKGQIRNQLSG